MTNDRDDSERRDSAAEHPHARTLHGFESGDQELVGRAVGDVAASLLQDGLSPSEILAIAREAYRDYVDFRKYVVEPRPFLVRQILARARWHIERRGIDARSDPEGRAWHLLDIIRIREAVDTLTGDCRAVVYMVFYENKTYEDVAAELDTVVVYVERLLRGALEQLARWRPRLRES